MPKQAIILSARRVAALRTPGRYAVGGVPGLHKRVKPGGREVWVYCFQLRGRRRDMGLGTVDDVTLAEARQLAAEARRLVLAGADPIEQRRRERTTGALKAAKAMTFRQCAEEFIASHRSGWRNPKHAAQWPSTLETYVYPTLGGLPVEAIDVGLVMKVLEPIWRAKPETASRIRGRIESVLDWAAVRGYRQGDNPARWRGHLESLLPAPSKVAPVEHHPALPYADLAPFMAVLCQVDGIAARALEFAILTAGRTGEVLGAQWDEINLKTRVWTVPARRMKAGREHRVPLSNAALAIIERMSAIRHSDYVFPGAAPGRPLSGMAMLMLLRRMGRADLTAHGFRSTFSDWAAEATNFPSEVREMALAHTVGDKVEAAYRRGDLFEKRRRLAEAWSAFCDGDIAGTNVIDMVRHAAQ